MTEQLQGNMNQDGEEYGEEEEEDLSPDELMDNSANRNRQRRAQRALRDGDASVNQLSLGSPQGERMYPMRLIANRSNLARPESPERANLRVSNFIVVDDQLNHIEDELENSQTFLNPSQNLEHLRSNLA